MYNFVIYLHILGGFGFFAAHGVAIFVALELRKTTDIERIKTLLNVSASTVGVLYISLLLILITGIGGGFMGSWWGRGWIWASLITLVVVVILMFVRGSTYYEQLREAVGAPSRGKPPTGTPKSSEEIAALVKSPRPFELLAIGIIGLLGLLWLMVFKPF